MCSMPQAEWIDLGMAGITPWTLSPVSLVPSEGRMAKHEKQELSATARRYLGFMETTPLSSASTSEMWARADLITSAPDVSSLSIQSRRFKVSTRDKT